MRNPATHTLAAKKPKKLSGSLLSVFFVVLLASVSYGQTIPGTGEKQGSQTVQGTGQVPTLSVYSDEVSLDLVVHDKKKKLVLDLKPSDLSFTDNGTPVTLRNLHLVSGGSDTGHLVTLLFDPMQGPAATNAQEIANKVLKMVPEAGFSFAVLSLGSRLRLVQGFTGDRKAVGLAVGLATQQGDVQQGIAIAAAEKGLIALARNGVDASGKMVGIKERSMAQTLLAALEGSQRIIQDQHTRPSLAGLLALARSQQQRTERKTVIYFTQNGQLDSDAREMVHTIIGAATRANVSMYTIDMTGIGAETRDQLMTMMALGPTAGVNPTAGTVSPFAALLPKGFGHGPLVQTRDPAGPGAGSMIATTTTGLEGQGVGDGIANSSPLAALAASTGGAYIDGQDSVKKPLALMLQDMTTYYQASYSPPAQEYDGTFRAIAVKPLRAGLNIRTKSGYFSLPSGGAEGIRPFEAPLLTILSGSQLPADLTLRASVLRLGDLQDGNTNSLVIEVPVSDLEMRKDTNTKLYFAHLSIVAQIKDKNGTVVAHFGEDIPRHGALNSLEEARSGFITLRRHFIAVPGKYMLEAVVMDRNNANAGAQRIEFEIAEPDLGPSLSDMVLVRQMEAYRAEADSEEPMRYENGMVTPNLSGLVPRGAKSVSVFFILHPDPKATVQPALEMEVLRDGSPVGRIPLPFRQNIGASALPYLATIQTSSISPGLYDVTARMTQGGAKVERHVAFTVEDSRPADATLEPGSALTGATATDTVEKLQAPDIKPGNAGQLVIAVPDKAVPPPSPDEIQGIIADARVRAVSYGEGLPNFMCVEVTNRSVSPNGSGRWKHKDTVTEMLTYRNQSETRTLLRVDGKTTGGDSEGLKGTRSVGEFGGVLNGVFRTSSKTDFQWKETDALRSGTVQVFNYRVAHDNSSFKVTGTGNDQVTVGFHGQVFIDSATRSVRRITLVADDLPHGFSVHATSIAVDYDYIVINAHDYLLPIAGEVSLKQGRREAVLNQFELRDYRRFGSTARILP